MDFGGGYQTVGVNKKEREILEENVKWVCRKDIVAAEEQIQWNPKTSIEKSAKSFKTRNINK